jgi:hypothetical protein
LRSKTGDPPVIRGLQDIPQRQAGKMVLNIKFITIMSIIYLLIYRSPAGRKPPNPDKPRKIPDTGLRWPAA